MQNVGIVPVTASATSAKAAPKPDAASWQDALQAAGQAPDTDAPAPTVARDQVAKKPVVKSGDKTSSADTATALAAAAHPALAAMDTATEATASQHGKKTSGPPSDGGTAQTSQHGKHTATPMVASAVAVAVPAASQPSTMPGTAKADTGKIDAKQAAATQDTAAPPTPDAGQSDTPFVANPDKMPTITHDTTQPAASPQAGTITSTTQPAAITAPAATMATSQAAATHAGKTVPAHAAETSVPNVSAASSNKTTLTAAGTDDAPVLPVAAADKTDDGSDKQNLTVLPVTTSTLAPLATAQPVAATVSTSQPVIQPSTAGLAAAVTAMHQAGQSGATLRLDPPGLGTLAVHVALGQSGQVNVLFVPSTQDASNVLQNNLGGLGAALAQSGITLGQAQVGGQFNQNAGQGGYQPPAPQPVVQSTAYEAETVMQSGVSAYA